MKSPGKFKYGEWLPDLAELDSSGLTEASNVIFSDAAYRPYKPLVPTSATMHGGSVLASYRASPGASLIYTASTDGSNGYITATEPDFSSPLDVSASTPHPVDRACFTQYDDKVILTWGYADPSFPAVAAVALAPLYIGNGVSNFTVLTGAYGAAPVALYCGVVGQFVVVANFADTGGVGLGGNSMRWSGIDAPLNWPTPLSADAIAQQSGEQDMDIRLGNILGVCEGDQWSVVLMDGGIIRMTYIGGAVVFQFDTIKRAPGVLGPNAWIKVGQLIYYLSVTGAFLTDGTQSTPIGDGRIDRWFRTNADFAYPLNFDCGVDYAAKVLYWTFPLIGNSGVPNAWLAYNYVENRWTHGLDNLRCFIRGQAPFFSPYGLQAFNNSASGGGFTGTPGVATLTTGEAELNPGGTALVTGFRPQVSGISSVSVKVGSRMNQSDSVVLSAADTPDSFSGSANFLVDARYHRAEIDITGAFTQAIGGEFESTPTSGL